MQVEQHPDRIQDKKQMSSTCTVLIRWRITSLLFPQNGGLPKSNMYAITPMLQRSHASEYEFSSTSGACDMGLRNVHIGAPQQCADGFECRSESEQ